MDDLVLEEHRSDDPTSGNTPNVITEREADEAHKNRTAIIRAKEARTQVTIVLARHLRACHDQELWKYNHTSFQEFCADPEIDIEYTKATALIRLTRILDRMREDTDGRITDQSVVGIAEKRLLHDFVPAVAYSKSDDKISNLQDAEDLIDKAKTLSYEAFAEEADQIKGAKKAERRGDDYKPPEKLLSSEGRVFDSEGNAVGFVVGCLANENHHTLRIRLDNSFVSMQDTTKGPLELKLDC